MASERAIIAERDAAVDKANRAAASAKTVRQKMEEGTQKVVETALTIGGAFAASAAMHRYAKQDANGHWIVPNIAGAPVDGAIGAVGLLADIMGVGGDNSSYFGATGLGLVASFAARQGADVGIKGRENAPRPKVQGDQASHVGALGQGHGGFGEQQFRGFVGMGAPAPVTHQHHQR